MGKFQVLVNNAAREIEEKGKKLLDVESVSHQDALSSRSQELANRLRGTVEYSQALQEVSSAELFEAVAMFHEKMGPKSRKQIRKFFSLRFGGYTYPLRALDFVIKEHERNEDLLVHAFVTLQPRDSYAGTATLDLVTRLQLDKPLQYFLFEEKSDYLGGNAWGTTVADKKLDTFDQLLNELAVMYASNSKRYIAGPLSFDNWNFDRPYEDE